MEDSRGKFIVIGAGYASKVDKFFLSNQGLKSRFTSTLIFEDYTVTDLMAMYSSIADKEYTTSPDAMLKIQLVLTTHKASSGDSFGNAREVRRLFESIKENVATRVMADFRNQTIIADRETHLRTILPCDVISL